MSKYARANWVCWRPTDRYPEVREDNGRRIAVIIAQGYLTSDRAGEAIVHLIAAAPELLAVLEGLTEGPLSLNELNELMADAREVIAKAKGERT